MESSFYQSSLHSPEQSAFIYQSDTDLEDYPNLLASDDQKCFYQSESEMDDSYLQNENHDRPKITSPIRKARPSKRTRKAKGDMRVYSTKWTDDEHQKFLEFYELFKGIYSFEKMPHSRKRTDIFKEMSKHIKTKSPNQCKTHEQKYRQKLLKEKTLQPPQNLELSSSPKPVSMIWQKVNHDEEDSTDCFETSYQIERSSVSTTFPDQSPTKSFYEHDDIDKYLNLSPQTSSPDVQETKKVFNKISFFETHEDVTLEHLREEHSSSGLCQEVWSWLLEEAQKIPMNND